MQSIIDYNKTTSNAQLVTKSLKSKTSLQIRAKQTSSIMIKKRKINNKERKEQSLPFILNFRKVRFFAEISAAYLENYRLGEIKKIGQNLSFEDEMIICGKIRYRYISTL